MHKNQREDIGDLKEGEGTGRRGVMKSNGRPQKHKDGKVRLLDRK